MSLYEAEELGAPPTAVAGWSRGAKLMQSQMQLKKVVKGANSGLSGFGSSVNNKPKSGVPVLAPVIDFKSTAKIAAGASATIPDPFFANRRGSKRDKSRAKVSDFTGGLLPLNDPNWTSQNEYDPLWPNDYHKIVADIRDSKRNADDGEESHGKRRYLESGRDKVRDRFNRDDRGDRTGQGESELSGFGRRPRGEEDYSDEEDTEGGRRGGRRRGSRRSTGSGAGVAIAPPPSLIETSDPSSGQDNDEAPSNKSVNKAKGLGIAAKIMAKYGYKHGQGLGRAEQGMSQALSVEKTSKRGGRIVHEKDRMLPPPLNPNNQFGESFKVPSQDDIPNLNSTNQSHLTPPSLSQCEDGNENVIPIDNESEYGGLGSLSGEGVEYGNQVTLEATPKPSITDLMKNPCKVVLCKNMVGPGEVDGDLEPEVKEECNGKYGDVISVIVNELPNPSCPEEAVRIFIEFKRVESAIKAVIDLNGRFFGGREVNARFFDQDKFENFILTD